MLRNEGYTLRVDAEQLRREADAACLKVLVVVVVVVFHDNDIDDANLFVMMHVNFRALLRDRSTVKVGLYWRR